MQQAGKDASSLLCLLWESEIFLKHGSTFDAIISTVAFSACTVERPTEGRTVPKACTEALDVAELAVGMHTNQFLLNRLSAGSFDPADTKPLT